MILTLYNRHEIASSLPQLYNINVEKNRQKTKMAIIVSGFIQ